MIKKNNKVLETEPQVKSWKLIDFRFFDFHFFRYNFTYLKMKINLDKLQNKLVLTIFVVFAFQ